MVISSSFIVCRETSLIGNKDAQQMRNHLWANYDDLQHSIRISNDQKMSKTGTSNYIKYGVVA